MRKTCLDMIYELAQKDERIVYIGSDLGAGTLQKIKGEMPDRFFMEGISEQNIIGMAAGLALSGRIVYVNTLAVFITRRCYEQIVLDLCLHKANVRLIGNGGGLVYAPLGPTHLATDDIAILRTIPNMTIVAPADAEEMKRLMPQTVDYQGTIYIRLAMGGEPIVSKPPFKIGRAILMREGQNALIVTTGITLKIGLEVAEKFDCSVLHIPTIKPLDKKTIIKYASGVSKIVTIEEGNLIGGLGSAVAEIVSERFHSKHLKRIGIPDEFIDYYGTQESLMKHCGITTEAIIDEMSKTLL